MENRLLNEIALSIYRGGTSRGLMILKDDALAACAASGLSLKELFARLIDNINANSIDGLGGGISSTNKICLIDYERADADASWEFYQLGVCADICSNDGTCGNLAAAVAAYVLNQRPKQPNSQINLRLYAKNIDKFMHASVFSDANGRFLATGDFRIPGVAASSSCVRIDIDQPGFKYLADGMLSINDKDCNVQVIECLNIFSLIDAKDLGINAQMSYSELASEEISSRFKAVKSASAKLANLAPSDVIPRVLALMPSKNAHISVRVLSGFNIHKSCPASALYAIAASLCAPNSLAGKIANFTPVQGENKIIIEHLKGCVDVIVKVQDDKIVSLALERSARKIMQGLASF